MKALTLLVLLVSTILVLADPSASPSAIAPDGDALKQLLQEFLDGAGRNDLALHERFWADELIYTRSAGQRLSKADILRDMKAEAARKETRRRCHHLQRRRHPRPAIRQHCGRRFSSGRHHQKRGHDRSNELLQYWHVRKTRQQMASRRLAGDKNSRGTRGEEIAAGFKC